MLGRIGFLLLLLTAVGLASADQAAAQGRSADGERIRAWALRLIERYDKNGNKMLEKEERELLRGKPAGADLNGDDVITLNELVTHLSSDSSAPASPQTPKPTKAEPEPAAVSEAVEAAAKKTKPRERAARRRDSSASTPDRKKDSPPPEKRRRTATDQRASYRFKSPVERLPAGLPSWFASRDTNQDGQVAMSEYSRTWTDRTAEEFLRQDLNNDGFITPAESLRGN
jgi:hypothetical protein